MLKFIFFNFSLHTVKQIAKECTSSRFLGRVGKKRTEIMVDKNIW